MNMSDYEPVYFYYFYVDGILCKFKGDDMNKLRKDMYDCAKK